MLTASVVAYFPLLDLGYGGALERFVAHYRTRQDARALNELVSTLIFIFAGIGLLAFGAVAAIAWNVGALFNLSETQAHTGRVVLLMVGLQYTLGLPFAVFGAVVNGFQRTFRNGFVGIAVALAVAVVNVAVLRAGGDLVSLVAAMTATRCLGYLAYQRNAYVVFSLLRIRPSLFRVGRLRELTGFSVYMFIQGASNRINYASDPIVIAAFLTTGAVAVWTVAQRLADLVLRLASQLSEMLFPVIVDCDSGQHHDRLRELLVQGTRLSLALVVPVAGALALLAHPVVVAWTSPEYRAAAVLVQLLSIVVLIRVGTATASMVLRGAGHLRLLALSNLAVAAANIALSILLIRTYGLPGVAVATLIPMALRAGGILIPVACVRVGITLRRFLADAIWPAAWPALPTLGLLAFARSGVDASLLECLLYGGLAGGLYALLFVGVAIGRRDRRLYLAKLRGIAGWPALKPA
jgi:O-antigen/teichoic acid export membrane protein